MDNKIAVARCHEIQLAIRDKEVPRFETIPEIGMAVQLALHLRGLPLVEYEKLKLIASTMLGVPRLAVDRIIILLAEIEFVRLQKEGRRIKAVLPLIPYFDDLYEGIGEYFSIEANPDEFEVLTLEIVDRLAGAPYNVDALAGKLGAERKAFDSSVEIGTKGNFLISRRARSKTVLLNPSYYSENADVFIDHVAKCGANGIKRTMELIQKSQGWPLSLIERTGEIGGTKVSQDDVQLLKKLAQEGAIKPPKISTSHAGDALFMFTPTPGFVNVNPLRREVYERSLAIVSAVRQGQLLPNKFRIRSPGAVLYTLKRDLQLSPTSDYAEQYRNLVDYRIAQLVQLSNGYWQLKIIDTPENREALDIALRLVQGDNPPDTTLLDREAHQAMTGSQEYIESLVSARQMRERETVVLSDEKKFEYEQILLEGM
ncbi:hypothetical protein [Marinimicrobium locisalis]|uniref:hypothetical protein n=1 Tax=Marinimicrobium locisalis TaxID=546022 RepID=UPI003221C465